MSVRFDAIGDRYTATTGLPTGNAYTVTCWAYIVTDRNSYSGIFSLSDLLCTTDVDGTSLKLWDTTNYSGGQWTSTALTAATWYRIGVVVNAGAASLYSGIATGSLSVTTVANFTTPNPPTELVIGSDIFDEWWNGRVGSFKLWNAALTATEVAAELAQFNPVRTTSLLRVHNFKTAGTGDDSGNGRTLTAGTTATTTEADPPIPDVVAVVDPTRFFLSSI